MRYCWQTITSPGSTRIWDRAVCIAMELEHGEVGSTRRADRLCDSVCENRWRIAGACRVGVLCSGICCESTEARGKCWIAGKSTNEPSTVGKSSSQHATCVDTVVRRDVIKQVAGEAQIVVIASHGSRITFPLFLAQVSFDSIITEAPRLTFMPRG